MAGNIGDATYKRLLQHLRALEATLMLLDQQLSQVNDPDYRLRLEDLIATAKSFVQRHRSGPRPSIADEAKSLLSAVRMFDVPLEDSTLGTYTQTLQNVRSARASLNTDLMEMIEAAAGAGALSLDDSVLVAPGIVNRDQVRAELDNLSARLQRVDESLASLARHAGANPTFEQQPVLIEAYRRDMAGELELAELQLTVNENSVDLTSVTRIVETMSDLTADFVSTIVGWKSKISAGLLEAATSMKRAIQEVVAGIKMAINVVVAKRYAGVEEKNVDQHNPIGSVLQNRRKELGLTLSQVSNTLRVKGYYLERIEAGKFSELPGWTYAISWVSQYATLLELDGNEMGDRLRKHYGDPYRTWR